MGGGGGLGQEGALGSGGRGDLGELGRGILGLPKPLGEELGPHQAFFTRSEGSFGPLHFVPASSPTRTLLCLPVPSPTPPPRPYVCLPACLPDPLPPSLRAVFNQAAQNFPDTALCRSPDGAIPVGTHYALWDEPALPPPHPPPS